jgi:hypothetical protein
MYRIPVAPFEAYPAEQGYAEERVGGAGGGRLGCATGASRHERQPG